MNNYNNNNNNTESVFVFALALLFLFFVVVPAVYAINKEIFNNGILSLSAFQIRFFTHFSEKALQDYQIIKAMNPITMTFTDVYLVLEYTGKWMRYPVITALCIMGVVSIFLSNQRHLHRKFTMDSLLKHNALNFPCVNPIVDKGEYLLSSQSLDIGLWKVARTPAQFCVEHELLEYPDETLIKWEDAFKNGVAHVDMRAYGQAFLNKNNCIEILEQQIGIKKREYHELEPIRKVLVSAFLAFGNENKEEAIAILDTCSTTYFEHKDIGNCKCFSDANFMEFVENIYSQYKNTQSKLIAMHNDYEITWLMGLLFFARKKGLLAPSQFLFVRPIDRSLWYALHQCGGRVAWSEAISAWTHYHAEESAKKSFHDFNGEPAYDFLHVALNTQGWLYYGD